jgi:hypothetical protein
VLHRQLFQVKAGRALTHIDACGGIKRDIRAEIAERVLQVERLKDGVAGVKLAAAEDHPALGFLLQRQKGVQGVAHGGKRDAAVDGFDNPRRGGSAVKKQRLVRLYQ